MDILERWDKEKSEDLYGINNWGKKYFSISKKGDVLINPTQNEEQAVSLIDIVSGIKDRGLEMPVLLRFENILDEQISYINESFRNAINDLDYKGTYQGVYPIKVNQQQQVVKEVAKFGKRYHHGFEVGSKAELLAALSEMTDRKACLVCNGYKDEEFIDLGLNAIKLGFTLFFVIEIPGELEIILDRAEKLKVKPNIGVRIKLASKASGHWTESGGDRSIFGLNMSQIIEVIEKLRSRGMLDTLKMMHYHLGSQIPNIRDIRKAVYEATRVYVELVKEGAPMGYLDLGGGLAVDYDGSNTNYINSSNYSIEEYCVDIVEAVKTVLDISNVPHPVIMTESGRALVAYYSVLIFNVLDVAIFESYDIPDVLDPSLPEVLHNIHEANKTINLKNLQECYNDILYYRDKVRDMFNNGDLSLRERALAEKIFWNTMHQVVKKKDLLKFVPSDLEKLENIIADIYYCNFSIFQSIPDCWAIDQLFPIMPIHRLLEHPSRNSIIADITCDCDGKIDKFIDIREMKHTLPLHPINEAEDYYIGVFLVGAYQETLGDLHNLFGDTNVASVRLTGDGKYDITNEVLGDSVDDVLSYVEYDSKSMRKKFRIKAEQAVKDGLITPAERKEILQVIENGLQGYTYYER